MRTGFFRASMARLLLFLLIFALPLLSGCGDSPVDASSQVAPPAPSEPADGAETADAVLLRWSPVENALRYRVQVASDAGFTSLILEETVTSYSRLAVRDLIMNQPYYWRVRSEGADDVSDWSDSCRLKVTRTAHIPPSPTPTAPAFDARDQEQRVRLEWEPVEGAYAYHLVVTLDEDMFLYQADLENLETTTFDLENLVLTYPYWWKVRALGPAGYSEWSSVWLFWVKSE